MKKTGQFFFIFVPFLLVNGIQLLATFFSMGLSCLVEFAWYSDSKSTSASEIFDDLSLLWSANHFNEGIMIIYALMTIAVFGIWYYSKYGGNYTPQPKSVFHPLTFVGILMLVPGLQYLSSYIVSFTATLFPAWLRAYEELLESAGLDKSLTIGMLLYSVILAPFCEELIFRGVTLRQARKCLPFWLANLMQAMLFGVFHMNMIQGIYAFCLGLFFGYVCEKSGSIYNSILLHLLFNFWGTVLSQFFGISNTPFSIIFWFIFAIVMTIGGLFVFKAGVHRCVATPPDVATQSV